MNDYENMWKQLKEIATIEQYDWLFGKMNEIESFFGVSND